MKLAVIGTHGVGKTTLSLALAAEANKRGRNACHIGEVVRESPFEINENNSAEGAYWIVATQIQRELEASARGYQDIICDRSSADPMIYMSLVGGEYDGALFSSWYNLALRWLLTYDMIILMKSDDNLDIKPDGVRSTDRKFRDLVNNGFVKYIERLDSEIYSNKILDYEKFISGLCQFWERRDEDDYVDIMNKFYSLENK